MRQGRSYWVSMYRCTVAADTAPTVAAKYDTPIEHYGDSSNMALLGPVFAGAPSASIWEQPPGHWSEW